MTRPFRARGELGPGENNKIARGRSGQKLGRQKVGETRDGEGTWGLAFPFYSIPTFIRCMTFL